MKYGVTFFPPVMREKQHGTLVSTEEEREGVWP
jgi:hypothetical protein